MRRSTMMIAVAAVAVGLAGATYPANADPASPTPIPGAVHGYTQPIPGAACAPSCPFPSDGASGPGGFSLQTPTPPTPAGLPPDLFQQLLAWLQAQLQTLTF